MSIRPTHSTVLRHGRSLRKCGQSVKPNEMEEDTGEEGGQTYTFHSLVPRMLSEKGGRCAEHTLPAAAESV